jgi:outer membrane protein OmpA-like peptidoglycan-associated protein
MQAVQARLTNRWGWLDRARWDFDDEASTLVFSEPGRPTVVADVRLVDSYSTRTGTFQWAWQTFEPCAPEAKDVARVRVFGEVRGLADLTTANWACEEAVAWEWPRSRGTSSAPTASTVHRSNTCDGSCSSQTGEPRADRRRLRPPLFRRHIRAGRALPGMHDWLRHKQRGAPAPGRVSRTMPTVAPGRQTLVQQESAPTHVARSTEGDDGDWWSPWAPAPGGGQTDGPGAIDGEEPPAPGKPKAKDPYQAKSYYQPEPDFDGPSAGIYFPLEGDALDLGDDKALEALVDAHADEILAGKLRVVVRGHADPRRGIYDEQYNQDLAKRRAEHTAQRLRLKLQARGFGVAPEIGVEVFGEDHLTWGDKDNLAQGRRADVFLRPDKPLIGGEEREPAPPIEPTTRFRIKLENKTSAGIKGLGMMMATVKIEREDTPGVGAEYGLFLGGATGMDAPDDTEWAPLVTAHPCHETDFAGLANAGGLSAMGHEGFILILHYPVTEAGVLRYEEVTATFKGETLTPEPDAELLIGHLAFVAQY